MQSVARAISIVFHPLLILTYGSGLLIWLYPYVFGYASFAQASRLWLIIVVLSFVLPAFSIFLMRQLDMISSYTMEERMDRVGPLIATGTFYLWLTVNFIHNPSIPIIISGFVLGSSISLGLGFFMTVIGSKISLHAIGMGGWLAVVLIFLMQYDIYFFEVGTGTGVWQIGINWILYALMVATGTVMTSRLVLRAHTMPELLGGLAVGILGQLLATLWLNN